MRRVKGNEEFVKWWDRWTRRLQRNRASTQPSQLAKEGPIGKPEYAQGQPGGNYNRPTAKPAVKPYDEAS